MRLVAVLAVLLMGCAPSRPAYHVREVRAVAPSLPAPCGSPRPCSGQQTWVVFYSTYCSSCHRLLEDLERSSATLERRGVCVATYLLDAEGCPEAMRVSHRTGDWPVAPVDEEVLGPWKVETSPLLYVVESGIVRARVQGRAPIEDLLALTLPEGPGD